VRNLPFSLVQEALSLKNPFQKILEGIELSREEDVLCYLQYHSAKHVLVVRAGVGKMNFENLGIPLAGDKSFDLEKLKRPGSFELLARFVEEALERSAYVARPVRLKGEPLGLLLLAGERSLAPKDLNEDWVDAIEWISKHRLMERQLEKVELMNFNSDLLSAPGLELQVTREVARAHRLNQPVSCIVFRVDKYAALSSQMNGLQIRNWMRAIGRLLKSNSRVNDHIGQLEEGLFAVILPHTDAKGAQVKATRISQMISKSELRVGSQKLKFSFSSAINEYPNLSEDAPHLISKTVDLVKLGPVDKQTVSVVQPRFSELSHLNL